MSDPAVAAARRAFDSLWPDQGDFKFNFDSNTRDYAVRSAREALLPIRALLEEWDAGGLLDYRRLQGLVHSESELAQ